MWLWSIKSNLSFSYNTSWNWATWLADSRLDNWLIDSHSDNCEQICKWDHWCLGLFLPKLIPGSWDKIISRTINTTAFRLPFETHLMVTSLFEDLLWIGITHRKLCLSEQSLTSLLMAWWQSGLVSLSLWRDSSPGPFGQFLLWKFDVWFISSTLCSGDFLVLVFAYISHIPFAYFCMLPIKLINSATVFVSLHLSFD